MHVVLAQFYSAVPTPAYQEIANALRALGHTVWVGVPNEAGDLEWWDGERVISQVIGRADPPRVVVRIPLVARLVRWVLALGFLVRLRQSLRRNKPDIVQVNPAKLLWFELLPLLMPRHTHFVLDFRQVAGADEADGLTRAGRWPGRWRHQICARFIYDHACFLHPAGARATLGNGWSRWGTVVPLGVDPAFVRVEPAGSERKRTDRCVSFLYLGRLTRVRRLELILTAAQLVLKVTDRFQVVLMGPDAARGFYHRLVDQMGLASVVAIRPPVPYRDVPGVILEYDVALAIVPTYPADWQYHPTLKVLEYRSLGIPIVATEVEPNREVVEDGRNGLLVEDTAHSLADAMLRMITDRDFLETCQANARAMRAGTTWPEVAEMYEQDVYLRLRG